MRALDVMQTSEAVAMDTETEMKQAATELKEDLPPGASSSNATAAAEGKDVEMVRTDL